MPNMGMNAPTKKGPSSLSLADALFSTTQQRVLAYLYGQVERSFFASELIRLTGGGSGAVQRELAKLEQSGLVTVYRIGNQKHYQANPGSPIFDELHNIVVKTVGVVDVLRAALAPLADAIDTAFIYGSLAKGTERADSDIDLMLIGKTLSYGAVMECLGEMEVILGRVVNPSIYSPAELEKKLQSDNAFVKRVMDRPKIVLIGSTDDINQPRKSGTSEPDPF
jgi:predicted nucleotidyltransferase